MPNSIKTILEKYLSNFKLYSYDETNETLYNELCNIYPTSTFEKFWNEIKVVLYNDNVENDKFKKELLLEWNKQHKK